MRYANRLIAGWVLTTLVVAAGCVTAPPTEQGAGTGGGANKTGPVRIGFSMDTLKEERWQRDKELFEAHAKELGAQVFTEVANGDDSQQVNQADNLLTRGIDVLVVVPHNGEIAASIVNKAKAAGVPVISYDRLIKNSDVDLYVSHQVEKIGEMQAQYALDKVPKGNYVLIGGAPTDNNALLLRVGQKRILDPAVARGDIKIVADPMARDWLPVEALKHTENALTQNSNNVQAIVSSNDGTAGGAIQALESQRLVGKVVVTGQDADLAACQRVVEGRQSMTIYKPIKPLAYSAVENAVKLARGEKPATSTTVNNGKIDVPAILEEPISVDANNMATTVIKDGFWKTEDVYKNVPRDKWPK
ncbi:MAG: substrate-binding domain-containing protein [Pyrinomonadaceae bacterium]|nr:substrate-binding domain-containing protein [Pyrinomonadaceae bacterium]